jgi:ferritin-like protein
MPESNKDTMEADVAPPPNDNEFALGRRLVLKSSLGMLAGVGVGTFANLGLANKARAQTKVTDASILNFALNLEYLEAEYYLRAVTGQGLSADETSGEKGTKGVVTGGSMVPFQNDAVQQYAAEIANDERAHVNALRAVLGDKKVAEPDINFTDAFNTLAQAAGLGDTFDPFASEDNFIIGSFVFEDVGVTAYKGAASLIKSPAILDTAAGFLAVEAYHAGIIRLLMYQKGLRQPAALISSLRDKLDDPTRNMDQGIINTPTTRDKKANLVPTDMNGLAFSRTTDEVLNIVYAGGQSGNFGFFPSRFNGAIR